MFAGIYRDWSPRWHAKCWGKATKLQESTIMDGGLTELFVGVTAGAYSPLALIAAWKMLRRTMQGNMVAESHQSGG